MQVKRHNSPLAIKADGQEGDVVAVIATFDVVDSDGDVTLPTAFTDGQPLPLVWSHDWSKPVGKGVVRIEPNRAIFDGRFFLDTQTGLEAYRTVKAMGDLQEFSWGFRIIKSEPGDFDGRRVRFIQQAEVFEASPVLVGANRETGLISIKAGEPETKGLAQPGSYEERINRIADALNAEFINRDTDVFAFPVSTHTDHVIAGVYTWTDDEPLYYRIAYSIDPDGAVTLGEATRMEQTFVPASAKGRPLVDDLGRLLADSAKVKTRVVALAALRAKEGRAISTARREQLGGWAGSLREIAGAIDTLLEETAPAPKASDEARRQRIRFEAWRAQQHGVKRSVA